MGADRARGHPTGRQHDCETPRRQWRPLGGLSMKIVLTRREALDTPDGINLFLFTLAEALLHRGHEVVIVSSAASDPAKLRTFYPLRRWPEVVPLGNHTSVHYSRSLTAWLSKGKQTIRDLRADMVIV